MFFMITFDVTNGMLLNKIYLTVNVKPGPVTKFISTINTYAAFVQINYIAAAFFGSLLIIAVAAFIVIIQRRATQVTKLISSLNEYKARLTDLENEKEWLIQEINHRVKNNLQIVTSLLNNQVAYLKSEEALQAIAISQHRLYTISLAYQKLYKNDSLSAISIPHYIKDLIFYLKDELRADKKIVFDIQAHEAYLTVTHAVPLGLIINEAISNAIKYAFPGETGGQIQILFSETHDDHYRLIISDNGVGFPAAFQLDDGKSLGMSLIAGLSKQLGGKLELKNEKGVSITVDFANLRPASGYGDNTKLPT